MKNCASIIQLTAKNTDVCVYIGVLHFVNSALPMLQAKALDEGKLLFEGAGVFAPEKMKAHHVDTRESPIDDIEGAKEWAEGILVMIKEVAEKNGGDPDLFVIGPVIEA